MALSDFELIHQACAGDMRAFEELVHRHDRDVLSIAATYVTSSEDAKDIYQEVFIRVFKGLSGFQFRSEFSTWLYRITTNVCLSHRRRFLKNPRQWTTHSIEAHEDVNTLAAEDTTDGEALNSEISEHVRKAIDHFSPHQKLVFTLRHYQGYKLKEIAKMMDCTEGTVKRYLFSATRRMRQQLQGVFQ